MAVCKYFQQGTCRFGQYCRFEHVNFDVAHAGENKPPYCDGKSIVVGIAEEVLLAERGGQWLLSCFGPFKEQPCIPGMEDVSPEEIHWEIYQAQKKGHVEQTKMQLQQLCQEMNKKREALKNPNQETAEMLEKLHKSQRGSTYSSTLPSNSTFCLTNSHLRSNTGSIFPSKLFPSITSGSSFAETYNNPASTQGTIFANTTTATTNGLPFFGTTSAFGSAIPQSGTNEGVFSGKSLFPNSNASLNNTFGTYTNNHTTTKSIFGASTTPIAPAKIFSQQSNNHNNDDPSSIGSGHIFGRTAGMPGTTISPSVFNKQVMINNNSIGSAFDPTTSAVMYPQSNHIVSTQTAIPMLNLASSNTIPLASTLSVQNKNYPIIGNFSNTSEAMGSNNSTNTIFNATKLDQQTALSNEQMINYSAQLVCTSDRASFSLENGNWMIDESLYSNENHLTNDEKMLYYAINFELGKIPIKPPTIEIK